MHGTKEMLVKVVYSDRLKRKDVVTELKNGIRYVCGSGDPGDWYVRELGKTKISLVLPRVVPSKNVDNT